MKNKIISYRKQICGVLKKAGIKYDYSSRACQYYIGEGFYINHRRKAADLNRIYGYDKHWAYGGALISKKFPLSEKIGDKPTELGVYLLFFKSFKRRYTDFYYTLYKNYIQKVKDGYVITLTNLDYEVFKDLWICEDLQIVKKGYFQDIGYLPLKDVVEKAYKDKKVCPDDEKYVFEAAFYGYFAKKLWDYETPWAREKYFKVKEETGDEKIREKQIPIAIWQTAYLRHEEWKLFKKNIDKVVYMNTDSIYMTEDTFIEEDKGLGYYGKCYDGEYIQFIRRNAYVVLNDDMTIKDRVIGGVADELNRPYITSETLQKLRDGESITVLAYEDDKKSKPPIEIALNPDFIQYLNGECKNIKYII